MTGTKLKVTVLYDLWEEEPAEVQEEAPPPRKRKGQKKRKKKPVKHDREEIFEALEKLGHEPSYHVLDGRPQSLLGLAKCSADLIFNLTESYAGDDTKEMHVAAFLDMLDIPLHRRGTARGHSCAGQIDRQEDVRFLRDSSRPTSRHPIAAPSTTRTTSPSRSS
jgi:hypothetical protein